MNDEPATNILKRLAGTDPVAGEDLRGMADEPRARQILAEICSGSQAPAARRWPGAVGAFLPVAVAAGALVVGVILIPGTGTRQSDSGQPTGQNHPARTAPRVRTAPDTPDGRRVAIEEFGSYPKGPPNETVRLETTRAVFSWQSRFGEYTIWRARTVGARGSATLFSSPRGGLGGSYGIERRLPRAPYAFHAGGGASPLGGYREVYGRASAEVAKVRLRLKDGTLRDAELQSGWWVFAQDFGNSKPVAIIGLDARGRVIVTNDREIF